MVECQDGEFDEPEVGIMQKRDTKEDLQQSTPKKICHDGRKEENPEERERQREANLEHKKDIIIRRVHKIPQPMRR